MPDALYKEEGSGRALAIERTSIVYPPDHMKRHENDHIVMDYLSAHLPDEVANANFELQMPFLAEFHRKGDVQTAAEEICKFITENWMICKPGEPLQFRLDHLPYEYCLLHPYDTSWDEDLMGPRNGITYCMRPVGGQFPGFSWNRAHLAQLMSVFQKGLKHVQGKFAEFPDARRLLLLERRGDIYGPLDGNFCELLSSLAIPPEVDEIWDAWIETPDYSEPFWIFTRLWAKELSLPSGWLRPEICGGRPPLDKNRPSIS